MNSNEPHPLDGFAIVYWLYPYEMIAPVRSQRRDYSGLRNKYLLLVIPRERSDEEPPGAAATEPVSPGETQRSPPRRG